ncbi:MAG: alpha-amylase [Deltaproteobacteria bacterium]|nr:alpha-amylase [Deltaproteobacteria bacterium]
MGVWTLGQEGPEIARQHVGVRRDLDVLLPGWRPADVVGSPFAIARYAVDPSLGGDAALAELRARLASRSIGLLLDFVPNHTARDHHWIAELPALYVRDADGAIACGKDPYFPPWTDTAQLDYRLAITRAHVTETLLAIATRADGVRCDMSMLLLSEIFGRTWQHCPPAPGEPLAAGEFWADAIAAVRARSPGFTFLAEAYWNLELRLQRLGFDFTYDKTLYDRLLHGTAAEVRMHLEADLELQARSTRFLENHDEPRLAQLLAAEHGAAALVIGMTLPGMRFVHEGQIEGRQVKTSVHLGRRVVEPPSPTAIALHERVLELLRLPALRRGHFRRLALREVWPGNRQWDQLVAHRWEHPDGSVVVIVNYAPKRAQARVVIDLHGIDGRPVVLRDLMTGTEYPRDGSELVDPARGLFVDLAPWQAHVFVV